MRHKVVELPLIPGALSDDTDLAAKLHAVDMDKVRFRGNRAETIKGWTAFNASGMSSGTARGVYAYGDLDGNPIVVAASETKVNAWVGGTRYDITPYWADVWLASTAISIVSTTATVTWLVYTPSTDSSTEAAHGLAVGDSVTFSGVVNDTAGTTQLNATYTIVSVPTPTTFTFTVTGTGSTPSQPFVCTVAFRSGIATGTGNTAATRARVYSIDNFGENAVFCGSDGTPIFAWQAETSSSNVLTNGTFTGNATGWTAGGGWAYNTNNVKHSGTVSSDLKQDISGVTTAGKVYELSFAITTIGADLTAFRVLIDSVDVFPPTSFSRLSELSTNSKGQLTYTFRFVCPADPQFLIFRANGAGATSIIIDTVSLAPLTTAFRINEAPVKNYALFVDGNRMLNALGTVGADGVFNPTLVRWCDQDNYREWVPDTTNLSGEYPLGTGSAAICGAQVGGANLILTDSGAFTANFTGTSDGYSFRQVGRGCGAIGQRALAVYNGRAFWASLNGFYAFDGAQVLPIECPIKDRYAAKLTQYQENKVFAWMNTEYGEVWFHYPHTSDGNEVSRYLIFGTVETPNPWSFGTWNRTCMTGAGIFSNPIGIDSTGAIWNHETGTGFSGSGITLPFIETGYVTGEAGDRWLGCRRYYPDFENQTGDILFTVTGKRAPQGSSNTQVIGPKTLSTTTSKVDFLLSARQLKFKWASSTSTTQWRLGVVGLEMRAQKERR